MGINDLYGSLRVWGQGDNNSYTGFSVVHSGTGIADFIVRSGGKIGMGTSLPDWDLELFRDGSSSEAAIVSDGGDAVLNFQTRDETDSYVVHRKGDIGIGNAIWAAGVDYANGTGSYNTYVIATGTTFQQDHQLVITSGGTVGIRKLAPAATLDIAGDLMVRDVVVGGDYNLIWDSTTNSVKRGNDIIPVNLTGTTFLVSGYTTGCTTFLVYSSNTGHQTFSANTCEDFGPYRYGQALQSIEPKLGANQANAKYSVIGGGRHNIIMSGDSTEDNVIAAGNSNIIEGGFTSSGIFAGKQNKIVAGTLDNYNVIAGGILNTISGESYSSILGSTSSKIIANVRVPAYYSAIVGGSNHFLHGSAYGAIVGGINSVMSGSQQSIIVGGTNNKSKHSTASFIGGGGVNVISGSTRSAIIGGTQNEMSANTLSVIVGGLTNILDGSDSSVIVGGTSNKIHENADVVIVGGSGNTIEKTAISSAIIGASELIAMSAQTTYLRGLNVNSDVAGNTPNGNWLQYHGINADQGLGRVLVSHDNDGHAKWKNLANLIPSGITSFSGSDVYVLTAYTSGCTWYGVTNSGTTLTADTCSSAGPYKYSFGANSIVPVMGFNSAFGLYGSVVQGVNNNNIQDYTVVFGGIANTATGLGEMNTQFGIGNMQLGGSMNHQYGTANQKISVGSSYAEQQGSGNMILGGYNAGWHTQQRGAGNIEIGGSGNTVNGLVNLLYNTFWCNVTGHQNFVRSGSTLSHVSGARNSLGGNFATILNSSGSTVMADGGHVLGGTGNTIYDTARSSAILGGNAITARTSQTTYTHGLNVWTDTGDGDRPFHYHGGAANNIIIPNSPAYSGSPNVFLAGVNADGRARWAPVPGSVQPQYLSGDSYVVSAHTIGCTLYLYTNSGTTVTADTCNNFSSPYKWAGPMNSWNPTSPGGPNENIITSEWSQILGGGDMLSGGTIGYTNLIRPKDKYWIGGGASVYVGNTVVGGTGNHILSGSISTIISGAWNKIVGQFGFSLESGGRAGGVGNVIAGGYNNRISGWTANFIGTGVNNEIKSGATSHGTILNGYYNSINSKGGNKESEFNQIINGQRNTITAYQPVSNSIHNGNTNKIIGRTSNVSVEPGTDPVRTVTQTYYNSILNGVQNLIIITANSVSNIQKYNTILNGSYNSASTLSQYSTILGGQFNRVNGDSSVILAGRNHHLNGNNSAVLAGYNHHIPPSATNSSILAGQDIYAYSADTSYTNLLNVQSAMTSTTITQILVRELDPKAPGGFGAIKVRDYATFSTDGPNPDDPQESTGGLISGNTEITGILSACTLVTANITACSSGLEDMDNTNIVLGSPVQVSSGLALGSYDSQFSPAATLSIEGDASLPALSAASNNSVVSYFLGRGTGSASLILQNESYTNLEYSSYLYSKANLKVSSQALSLGHTSYTPFGIFTGSSTNQMLSISGDSVMVGKKSTFNAWDSNQDFSSTLSIRNTDSSKDALSIYGAAGSLLAKFSDIASPPEVAFGIDPVQNYNATFTVDLQGEGPLNGRIALFNQDQKNGTKVEIGENLGQASSGKTYIIQSGDTSIFGQTPGDGHAKLDFTRLHQSAIAVKAGYALPYNIVTAESSGSTHLGIGTMHPTKPLTVIGQISGTSEMYLDGSLWSPRIYGYCNSGNTYNKDITQLTAVTINDVVQIGGGKNNNTWPELLVRGNGNAPTIEVRSDSDSVNSPSGYMALTLTHYSGTSNTQPIHEWRVIHAGNDRNQFQIKYQTAKVDLFEAEVMNKGVYAGSGQTSTTSLVYVSTGGTLATGGGFALGSFDNWSDRGGMLIKGWSNTPNYDALHIVNSGNTSLLRMRNSGDLGIGVKYPDTRLSVSGEVNTQVVSVTGDTTLDGALNVSGLTSFVGDSRFSEDVTINGGLTITASTYPGTPLFKADDNIVVIWPAKVGIGPVPLTISGTTNISGNTSIDGLLTLNSGLKAGGEDGKLDVIGGVVATFFTGATVSATSVHADTYITLGGKNTVKTESDGGTTFGDDAVKSEIKGTDVKLIASTSNVELSAPTGRGVTISSGFITGGTAYSANTAGRGSIVVPSPSSTFSSGSTVMGLARKYITQGLAIGTGDELYVTHNLNTKDIIVSAIGTGSDDIGENAVLGDASITINIMNYNTIKLTGVVEISTLKIVVMTI